MTAPLSDLLEDLMAREPQLNDFGFGLSAGYPEKPHAEQVRTLAGDRAKLRASLPDIAFSIDWLLANIKPSPSLNYRGSSYGLKHLMETDSPRKYLTNGVVIAAAVLAGYKYARIGTSPNARFNMQACSFRKVVRSRLGEQGIRRGVHGRGAYLP